MVALFAMKELFSSLQEMRQSFDHRDNRFAIHLLAIVPGKYFFHINSR